MYLKYYQLREEPFSLTPDPRFLHLAQSYRVALETVVQSIIRRKGFVVVNGPIGTGKTTLLHAAMQILSRSNTNNAPLASAFVLNPVLSREEFLETLITEFEVNCRSTSKPARLTALYNMFLEKQKHGGTSILIVDEAHLMTIELLEEIRLLSNADTYREKLLQVVLCGHDGALVIGFNTKQRVIQPDAIEGSATQLQLTVEPVEERPKAVGREADLEVVESALDLLIEAMKRKRTSTWSNE